MLTVRAAAAVNSGTIATATEKPWHTTVANTSHGGVGRSVC